MFSLSDSDKSEGIFVVADIQRGCSKELDRVQDGIADGQAIAILGKKTVASGFVAVPAV